MTEYVAQLRGIQFVVIFPAGTNKEAAEIYGGGTQQQVFISFEGVLAGPTGPANTPSKEKNTCC